MFLRKRVKIELHLHQVVYLLAYVEVFLLHSLGVALPVLHFPVMRVEFFAEVLDSVLHLLDFSLLVNQYWVVESFNLVYWKQFVYFDFKLSLLGGACCSRGWLRLLVVLLLAGDVN